MEDLLAGEARALNLPNPAPVPGGVVFSGKLVDGYRANLWLRIASRVLLRVAGFSARAPEEIVGGVRAIPWEAFLPRDIAIHLSVTRGESRIGSTGLVQTKILDALTDRLREVEGKPWTIAAHGAVPGEDDVDARPGQRLMARLDRNRLVLSLDSSGDLLHRRGYRTFPGPAPIRETLAAGILRFAGWDGAESLVDPMCGSGTFPIEAAQIACNLAPGRDRTFGFESWPSYRPATWSWLRGLAAEGVRKSGPSILGRDRDPSVLSGANGNASRAGVDSTVRFEQADFFESNPPPGIAPGLVVINPPYGLRLDPALDTRRLFRDIGLRLSRHWAAWRYALVVPDESLIEAPGLPITGSMRVPHGGLRITVITGRIPAIGKR